MVSCSRATVAIASAAMSTHKTRRNTLIRHPPKRSVCVDRLRTCGRLFLLRSHSRTRHCVSRCGHEPKDLKTHPLAPAEYTTVLRSARLTGLRRKSKDLLQGLKP